MLVQKEWTEYGHKFEERIRVKVNSYARTDTIDRAVKTYRRSTPSTGSISNNSNGEDRDRSKSGSGSGNSKGSGVSGEASHKTSARSKELSPVFIQFLDCVAQLVRQFPSYVNMLSRVMLYV